MNIAKDQYYIVHTRNTGYTLYWAAHQADGWTLSAEDVEETDPPFPPAVNDWLGFEYRPSDWKSH